MRLNTTTIFGLFVVGMFGGIIAIVVVDTHNISIRNSRISDCITVSHDPCHCRDVYK